MLTFLIVAACLLPLQGIFAEKGGHKPPVPDQEPNATIPNDCFCIYNNLDSNIFAYSGQKRLEIGEKVKQDSTIQFSCKIIGYHRLKGPAELSCQKCDWHSSEFPTCVPPARGEPIITVRTEPPDSFAFSPSGVLYVKPHVDVEILCHLQNANELIRLSGPRKEVKPTYDYIIVKGQHIWTGVLMLTQVMPRDSGMYICSRENNIRISHKVHIKIEDISCPDIKDDDDLSVDYVMEGLNKIAILSCLDQSKELSGPDRLKCMANGHWSEDVPKCTSDHKPPVPDQEPNDAKSVNTLRPQQLETTNAGDFVNLERSTQPVSKNPDVISAPEPLDVRNPNNCFCTYNNLDSNVAAYLGQKRLEFGERVKKDSIVQFNCKIIGYHRLKGPSELSCENCDWHWSEFPTCVPPARGEPIILVSTEPPGSFAFSPSGTVYVKPHVDVNITCHLKDANAEILLSGPQKEVKPAYGYKIVKGRHFWTGLLMLTQVMPRDSGMYICSRKNDSSISHQVHIKIEGDCVVMALPNGRFEFKTLKPRWTFYGRQDVAVFELVHLNTQHSNGTVLYVSCTSPYIFNGKGNASYTPVQCDRGMWRPQPSCLLASDQKQPPSVNPMTSLQTSRPVTKVPVVTSTVSANTEKLNKPKTFTRPSNFDHCTINKDLDNVNIVTFPVKEVYRVGEYVQFLCPPRYELFPRIERVTCLPSGWSEDFPNCRSIGTFDHCTINKELDNINIETFPVKDVYRVGENVQFLCPPRYELFPRIERATCLLSGWSEDFPNCRSIGNFDDCTIDKELGIANLEIFPVKEIYKFGEIVKFICSLKYELTPRIEQAVCLPSGWSNDFPHCTPMRSAG